MIGKYHRFIDENHLIDKLISTQNRLYFISIENNIGNSLIFLARIDNTKKN